MPGIRRAIGWTNLHEELTWSCPGRREDQRHPLYQGYVRRSTLGSTLTLATRERCPIHSRCLA